MLKEDLNGKLLQRAELVAHREEMDEIFETMKTSNKGELTYYFEELDLKMEVQEIQKQLQEMI